MTANQIANRQAEEQARSNKAREGIEKDKLKEQKRSNKVREGTDIAKTALSTLFGRRNDPSWYNLDKQLVKDVASVSYGQPLGSPINPQYWKSNKYVAPGMMAIHFIPSIGITGKTDNVPINVAAKNVYAYVRYANSGARNYEAVDLMLYILAMDNAIMQLQFLKTLYSIALTAKGENWYYGKSMLTLLTSSTTAQEILDNLAQFRAAINTYAVRLNSFYVPNTMPIVQRHAWLVGNIFKDYDVKKSQTYHFVPEVFYTYDDVKGKLNPNFTPYSDLHIGSYEGLSGIYTMMNTMINALTTSEDIGIMSGDILKAYGESKILYIESIDESFHIEATYSAEVLSQLNAATLVGACDDGEIGDFGVDIYQDDQGNIIMGSATSKTNVVTIPNLTNALTASTAVLNPLVINMYKDDVTPDDTMVASRLMAIVEAGTTNGSRNVTACGTEICLFAQILQGIDGMAPTTHTYYWQQSLSITTSTADSLIKSYFNKFNLYSKFAWAPRVSGNATGGTGVTNWTSTCLFYDSMDLANYASISEADLIAMHGVALLSEFGVPLLGVSVRTR